ncbi:DUF1754-domain-containing protein [Hypoxylon fragiforme]|uniref:DUF1754-domain-containing protein n=1 Tax=Hypoxylon fragiforme TaxID=63214 RepID=UPI0020C6C811|nr:DUF1754-domain-containing protein [Hypoxylon fragiforme]KAI2608454.1 DUF1754-domain-containing protein [Hypoxylon fragiforme]
MPTDEYASVAGGGALKLKGGKVQKNKKDKKKKKKSKELTIERSLSTEDNTAIKEVEQTQRDDSKNKTDHSVEGLVEHKTEAERRHEEANRKKMMKMLEDPRLASEFRKTHKERVEGLNTYLSKLSEHHDMPKIGPG